MPPPYIQIKDNFALLEDVKMTPVNDTVEAVSRRAATTLNEDKELTFRLSYDIKQSDVINSNITKIVVKIHSESNASPSNFEVSQVPRRRESSLDRRSQPSIIDKILVNARDSFEGFLSSEKKIISQTNSDPTAFINNELISILKKKTTDTSQVELANEYIGLGSSLAKVSNDDFPANLTDSVTVPVRLKFLTSSILSNSGFVFVTFEVIDTSRNYVLEIIERQIDVYRHLDVWDLPKKAPIINPSFNKSKYLIDTTLRVKQVDKSANGVKIYRKITYSNSISNNSYEYLGNFPIPPGQSADLKFTHPSDSLVSYRVIPYFFNKVSSCFGEVIYKDKFFTLKSLSLVSKVVNSGIKLECRNISNDVVSISFLQRNLTLKEKTFSVISQSYLTSENELISHIAKNLISDHTYEFSTRCIHKNSLSYDVGNEICLFMKQPTGLMTIKVENTTIESIGLSGEPEIKFNVKMFMNDSELNQVLTSIENSGNRDYFNNNLNEARENLNLLLFFQIERIELLSGQKENLGIFPYRENFKFSDLTESSKMNASPLRRGAVYRYAIRGITWNPEVISNVGKKTRKDPTTGIAYTYEPKKWGDPLSLKSGTILPLKNDETISLSRGLTGNIIYVDVSLNTSREILGVSTFNAELFDEKKISLKWTSNLNLKEIDHFVLFENSNSSSPIQVGKAHAQSEFYSYEWIYDISNENFNKFSFSIVPVNIFGEKMSEYTSNTIEVTNAFE